MTPRDSEEQMSVPMGTRPHPGIGTRELGWALSGHVHVGMCLHMSVCASLCVCLCYVVCVSVHTRVSVCYVQYFCVRCMVVSVCTDMLMRPYVYGYDCHLCVCVCVYYEGRRRMDHEGN